MFYLLAPYILFTIVDEEVFDDIPLKRAPIAKLLDSYAADSKENIPSNGGKTTDYYAKLADTIAPTRASSITAAKDADAAPPKHAVSTSYANLANRVAPTRASSITAAEDADAAPPKHAVSTSYANLANRVAPTRASSFTAAEEDEGEDEDDDDNYHPLRRIS